LPRPRAEQALIVVAATILVLRFADPPSCVSWLVVLLLAAVFLFPVALVRAGRTFRMVLDGPVVFTTLLSLPRGEAVAGIVIGVTIGQLLQSRPSSRRAVFWWLVSSGIHVVATMAAAGVVGPDPKRLRPTELLLIGGLAALTYIATVLALYVAPQLLGRRLRARDLPRAVAPSLIAAFLVYFLSAAGALASRSVGWAPLLLAVPTAGVIFLSRQTLRLRDEASHDALTGLPNRRSLESYLEAAAARLSRYGEPYAVAAIDLDHFKPINDALGHQAGDAVLVEIARRLSGTVRREDLVARTGGDEFYAVFAGATVEGAADLAERLRHECREPILLDEGEARVSASIGVAVGTIGPSVSEITRVADEAAYRAKRAGRDSVVVAVGEKGTSTAGT
jgi:diguanylate cyclase (GGDEF)-like protein